MFSGGALIEGRVGSFRPPACLDAAFVPNSLRNDNDGNAHRLRVMLYHVA